MESQLWFKPITYGIPAVQDIRSGCSSASGQLFVLGGKNGRIYVWDLSKHILQQTIEVGSPVTCISFAEIAQQSETFWVGLANGTVILYYRPCPKIRLSPSRFFKPSYIPFTRALETPAGDSVVAIASHGKRVAAATLLDLWIWDVYTGPNDGSQSLGTVPWVLHSLEVPKPLLLHLNGASGSSIAIDIKVTGKHLQGVTFLSSHTLLLTAVDVLLTGNDSHLAIYTLEPWRLVRCYGVDRRIGNADVSFNKQYLAFTDLLNGVELFALPSLQHISTMLHPVRKGFNQTLGITFITNTHLVAGGWSEIVVRDISGLTNPHKLCAEGTGDVTFRIILASPMQQMLLGISSEGNPFLWKWGYVQKKGTAQGRNFTSSRKVMFSIIISLLAAYIPLLHTILTSSRTKYDLNRSSFGDGPAMMEMNAPSSLALPYQSESTNNYDKQIVPQ